MDIRVNRSRFLAELAPMQGIVERKSTIPVLSHLLLSARDGKLHLAATDLDVSLTSSCEAEIGNSGSIAVQAKKFMEIIRSLVGDEVHLSQDEPQQLTIEAGNSRFRIHGLPAEDFPTLPPVDPTYSANLPSDIFRSMISKVLFAVSNEESRFQLNAALLKFKADSIELAATDSHRLALIETPIEGLPENAADDSVLISRKALQELLRMESDSPVEFERGEHHLRFRIDQRELTCRILEGTYPDYERVIARDNDKHVVLDRRTLGEAVQRAALLTGDRARAVKLVFDDNELVVSAANPDLGEARESLPCEFEGPALNFGINPDYLRDFLSAVDQDRVRLEMKDENSQTVGYPHHDDEDAATGRYLCVIMPMRI